jgi:hypothetical protein
MFYASAWHARGIHAWEKMGKLAGKLHNQHIKFPHAMSRARQVLRYNIKADKSAEDEAENLTTFVFPQHAK